MSRIRTFTATATMVAAATAFVAAPASAAPKQDKGPDKANSKAVDNRNNNTSEKLRQAASAQGGLEHLTAFQRIADANGGTRASGTPGYDASADYVVERLRAAGYTPEVQEFQFPFFEQVGPSTLTLGGRTIASSTLTYSGTGTISGKIIPVALALTGSRASTSACTAADFAGLNFSGPNDIALVQRGVCTFGEKVTNAVAAGAEAVVILNQGNTPERSVLLENVTLGGPIGVPVLGVSFDEGVALDAASRTGASATVTANTVSELRDTVNIIAQTSGNTDNVVMVGAHLDSVAEGPGINDNGSGSAGILEVAEAYAKTKPVNAVRFAWWGAEELGLLGSEYYVEQLTDAQAEDIALYLNFDMIASPNFARMVYDGDDSDGQGAGPGPEGSAQIEEVFTGFFTQLGLNSKATDFSGRSDYGPFIAVGIPSGGLFTGAEERASQLDNQLFGSVVGRAYDPCYHIACDTLQNLNLTVFEQNIDAIAHAVIVYGYSTSTVNQVAGDEGKGLTKVSGPGGGIAAGEGSAGGGGLREGHADHVGESS